MIPIVFSRKTDNQGIEDLMHEQTNRRVDRLPGSSEKVRRALSLLEEAQLLIDELDDDVLGARLSDCVDKLRRLVATRPSNS